MPIKRDTHVMFNPETGLWEVIELSPAEAFDLDQERYGVDVALYNLSYDEIDHDQSDDQEDQSCTTNS